MKKLSFIVAAVMALAMMSCTSNGTTSSGSSATDSVIDSTTTVAPSQQDVDELTKAMQEEHADADAKYTYDAKTNTVLIVKQVDVPEDQAEEDFAEALVEHQVPEFISQFKKSTKPSDATIKSKGATITVSYVNKATSEEITQFDITPDDLK